MADWIYSHPTWLWGTGFVGAATLLSCLGLAVVHRVVHVDIRRKHNDVMAAAMALVAASLSLVIVLIVALDRPFRGDLSVAGVACENVRGSIAAVDERGS